MTAPKLSFLHVMHLQAARGTAAPAAISVSLECLPANPRRHASGALATLLQRRIAASGGALGWLERLVSTRRLYVCTFASRALVQDDHGFGRVRRLPANGSTGQLELKSAQDALDIGLSALAQQGQGALVALQLHGVHSQSYIGHDLQRRLGCIQQAWRFHAG
jgi:hypothetical protein